MRHEEKTSDSFARRKNIRFMCKPERTVPPAASQGRHQLRLKLCRDFSPLVPAAVDGAFSTPLAQDAAQDVQVWD